MLTKRLTFSRKRLGKVTKMTQIFLVAWMAFVPGSPEKQEFKFFFDQAKAESFCKGKQGCVVTTISEDQLNGTYQELTRK